MVGNVPVALRPEANQQANPHKYEIDNFSSGRFFYGPHLGAPYVVVVNSGDFGVKTNVILIIRTITIQNGELGTMAQ